MAYRRFDIACMVVLLATMLVACDRPQTAASAPFNTEDECEDAGMSDAFCDRMFPEFEDFVSKKSKATKPPIVRPVYKPALNTKPPLVKPVLKQTIRPSVPKSINASSTRSMSSSRPSSSRIR